MYDWVCVGVCGGGMVCVYMGVGVAAFVFLSMFASVCEHNYYKLLIIDTLIRPPLASLYLLILCEAAALLRSERSAFNILMQISIIVNDESQMIEWLLL